MNNAGNAIPYRPVLRELTGDVKAAILLQQVIFNFIRKDREPFYKFQVPSQEGHPLYRDGDSWVEELGFSPDEFKEALKKIAVFVRRDKADAVLSDTTPVFGASSDKRCKSRHVLLNAQHLVVYWKLADNTRRYCLNEQLLINAINVVQTLPREDIPLQNPEKSTPGNGFSPAAQAESPPSYNIENSLDNSIEHNREKNELNLSAGNTPADESYRPIPSHFRAAVRDNSYHASEHTIAETPKGESVVPRQENWTQFEKWALATTRRKSLTEQQRDYFNQIGFYVPVESVDAAERPTVNEAWDKWPSFRQYVAEKIVPAMMTKNMLNIMGLNKWLNSPETWKHYMEWREDHDEDDAPDRPVAKKEDGRGVLWPDGGTSWVSYSQDLDDAYREYLRGKEEL